MPLSGAEWVEEIGTPSPPLTPPTISEAAYDIQHLQSSPLAWKRASTSRWRCSPAGAFSGGACPSGHHATARGAVQVRSKTPAANLLVVVALVLAVGLEAPVAERLEDGPGIGFDGAADAAAA